MKHTKLLVVALLVALIACLAMTATADCSHPSYQQVTKTLLPPTCTTKGVAIIQCTACGTTIQTIDIPATGEHTWDTDSKPASCGEDGYVLRKCTVCGTIEKTVLPKTNLHTKDVLLESQIPATCTTPGTDGDWYQCQCGYVFPRPAVVAAKGHDYTGMEWYVADPSDSATCAKEGVLTQNCKVCGAAGAHTMKTPKSTTHAANFEANARSDGKETNATGKDGNSCVMPYRDSTCTETGCYAIYECSICGLRLGGGTIAAKGHSLVKTDGNPVEWTVKTKATCKTEGVLGRKCTRAGCGAWVETQNVGKTSYHTDSNGTRSSFNDADTTFTKTSSPWTYTYTVTDLKPIIDAKPGTCTTAGCKAIWECPTCKAHKGGESVSANGHQIDDYSGLASDKKGWSWVDDKPADCTSSGVRQGYCSVCKSYVNKVTVPAYGHSAVWQVKEEATPSKIGMAQLFCTRCNKVIGMQILNYGDKIPSGNVNTGAAANTSTAKTKTTTTTTKKTSTAKTSTTTAKTTTAAAPAAATTKTATVVAAAAPAALPTNAAALKADTSLYIVKNVADEDIVLSVEVKDGKITVTADLAEGESLVLYANEDAIANPTAENTLVLTANEAVELPAEFANAILAVVKTESLPAAVAAK